MLVLIIIIIILSSSVNGEDYEKGCMKLCKTLQRIRPIDETTDCRIGKKSVMKCK